MAGLVLPGLSLGSHPQFSAPGRRTIVSGVAALPGRLPLAHVEERLRAVCIEPQVRALTISILQYYAFFAEGRLASRKI